MPHLAAQNLWPNPLQKNGSSSSSMPEWPSQEGASLVVLPQVRREEGEVGGESVLEDLLLPRTHATKQQRGSLSLALWMDADQSTF